ncbi:MAG: hypothetical protein WCG27_10165 [Pseudomonadota bacterium]
MSKVSNALENRPYKFKSPTLEFFCPLCRSERSFTYRARLSTKQYVQILMCTVILTLLTYSITDWRSFIFFFIFWAGIEWANRVLLRKQVPCPYCGFDASWYKRDVKVARQLVKDFWAQKQAFEKRAASEVPPPSTPPAADSAALQ